MRTICITVNDDNYVRAGGMYGTNPRAPLPMSAVRAHFAERGVDAQFFCGIHAPKLGLATTLPYEIDNPGSGFNIGTENVGCWLSHRALWAACLLLPDEMFFIIEDDALFPEDWRERVDRAVLDAGNFDILYIGSCCTEGKPAKHIAGNVFEIQWPFCTHGYIVRRSALPVLIETQDAARLYAPIDLSLAFHSLPKLKTRVVKPRILNQVNTEISP
jgi:GR25 family glycosyltransferase involved in LPS biosynthesis